MATRPAPPVPVLGFLGAAGTVTGSRFVVETAGARVLVDAGLFQGLKPLRLRNWEPFPVPPESLDAVIVTHAHVDHIGYLPALVRDGFAGPVFATRGTAELAAIVLPDSGHLQEEEAEFANRTGYSKHRPALPLYTEADGVRAAERFVTVSFGNEVAVAPGVHATLRPAGHILGSATVTVRLADQGDRRVVFSGDLGRPEHPILQPPAPIGEADVVVVESTYGDRSHHDDPLTALRDAINRTVRRGGTVVIPAFAVDRTEVVLLRMRELREAGEIPEVPIFVDSPLALASLRVYRAAIRRADPDIDPGLDLLRDPFAAGQVTEIHDVEDSKALARLHTPSVIVSASGMAVGGRVVHHLARLLPDHRNTVLLVGFQAPGTRGRALADGERQIKMLGRYVPVRADVVDLGGFSVHADRDELVAWLRTAERPPDAAYLVHGEPAALENLRHLVAHELGWTAIVARHGERVRLDA